MSANVSDLLAAESLLVTTVALLFTVWYPEQSAAQALPVWDKRADRQPQIAEVQRVLWTRSLPLVVASISLAAVFAYDAGHIVIDAVRALAHGRWSYNAISAALVVAEILAIYLAAAAALLFVGLLNKRRKLSTADA